MNDTLSDDIDIITDPDPAAVAIQPTEKHKRRHTPFLLLLNILMTGTAGWKDLRRARLKPEQAASGSVVVSRSATHCTIFRLPICYPSLIDRHKPALNLFFPLSLQK